MRQYRAESLDGMAPRVIAQTLTEYEANGWRLAVILPFYPGYDVNRPHALLYRDDGEPDATCYCPRCGAAHRSKEG